MTATISVGDGIPWSSIDRALESSVDAVGARCERTSFGWAGEGVGGLRVEVHALEDGYHVAVLRGRLPVASGQHADRDEAVLACEVELAQVISAAQQMLDFSLNGETAAAALERAS